MSNIDSTWKNKHWEEARKHFGIENDSNMVLHHKDENLRYENYERYCEWNPEDLVVMTRGEHTSHHWTGKKQTSETIEKMKVGLIGRHYYNNGEIEVLQYECPEGYVKGRLPYSDETKSKISESLKGNKNALGKHPSAETKEKLSRANIGNKNALGYKWTDERKAKLSEARKGNTYTKGMKWYNNGETQTMAYECPEGFTAGRLKKG